MTFQFIGSNKKLKTGILEEGKAKCCLVLSKKVTLMYPGSSAWEEAKKIKFFLAFMTSPRFKDEVAKISRMTQGKPSSFSSMEICYNGPIQLRHMLCLHDFGKAPISSLQLPYDGPMVPVLVLEAEFAEYYNIVNSWVHRRQ